MKVVLEIQLLPWESPIDVTKEILKALEALHLPERKESREIELIALEG